MNILKWVLLGFVLSITIISLVAHQIDFDVARSTFRYKCEQQGGVYVRGLLFGEPKCLKITEIKMESK